MTKTAAESSLKQLVALAEQAVEEYSVQKKVKIVGSVGPYAVFLNDGSEYNGNYVDKLEEQNDEQTNYSENFCKSVEKISHHPNILGIGISCTSPNYITPLLQSASTSVNSPSFIIYPNSGEKYEFDTKNWINGKCTFPNMEQLMEWWDLGAKVIGGCCRVGVEKIKELSVLAAKLNSGYSIS